LAAQALHVLQAVSAAAVHAAAAYSIPARHTLQGVAIPALQKEPASQAPHPHPISLRPTSHQEGQGQVVRPPLQSTA
jgi:hypothetical protein